MITEHAASSETVAATAHDATDETDTSHGETAATPEHPDGPSRHLALPARGTLRQGLIKAFTEILLRARQQDPDDEPTLALHQHRKAMRRARALLRLMDGIIGVQAQDILASTLRELHRATSALRDRHVVIEVLEALAHDESLDQGTVALIEQTRESIRTSPAPGVDISAEALADSVARLESLPQTLSNGLPIKVRWYAVADGLGTTYRRAQRQLRAARRTGADEAVHGLRKRTKELTYQVELLADMAGGRGHKTRKRLARLAQELGEVGDLMVVSAYMNEYVAPGPERDRLLETIEGARAKRLARALKRARALLDDGHEDFARKLTQAARKGRKAAR